MSHMKQGLLFTTIDSGHFISINSKYIVFLWAHQSYSCLIIDDSMNWRTILHIVRHTAGTGSISEISSVQECIAFIPPHLAARTIGINIGYQATSHISTYTENPRLSLPFASLSSTYFKRTSLKSKTRFAVLFS